MIELINLKKSYNETPVLNKINLFVQQGEIFGIIGKSGAGKSTLLRMINLLEHPDAGEVIIDNEDITNLKNKNLNRIRHKIGMIFQQFNLLAAKTVFENIALPMRIQKIPQTEINEKVKSLLALVELSEKAQAYPAQLSGGQKQRVAIARALSCSPKILLCDEATSALDPETTQSILNLLQKINRIYGITIVIVTHEMEVIKRICHTVALIVQGEIQEVTALNQLFNKTDSLARKILLSNLSPQLPPYILNCLSPQPNETPLLRLFFENETATTPFISQISRQLQLDINILLANIDHFNHITCGVLIVKLQATPETLQIFLQRCQEASLTVEILGYLNDL